MRHRDENEFLWAAPRHEHDMWWHGPLSFVPRLLVVALLGRGTVWLVRRLSPMPPAGAVGAAGIPAAASFDPAVSELRMRYARGEVARDDYLSTMADLTGRDAAAEADTAHGPPA